MNRGSPPDGPGATSRWPLGARLAPVMVLGAVLLVIGLPLALLPRRAMGAATSLRLVVVSHPSEAQVLSWRRWGAATVALAVVVLALA